MEDFTSNKQKEAARKLAELDQDDLYLREMESVNVLGLVSEELKGDITSDEGSIRANYAIKRMKNLGYFWGFVFFSVTNAALAYPLSVRIVKKAFKLTNFWHIHLAILPILLPYNGFAMGTVKGILESYAVSGNIQEYLDKQ